MRFRKIILENNPVFWPKVEFDFTKSDWTIYDNILLIGENGSWKSTLLDIIFQFSNYWPLAEHSDDEKRYFEIEFSNDELHVIAQWITSLRTSNIIGFEFDLSKWSWAQIKLNINWVIDDNSSPLSQYAKIFKSIYSTTEINFNWTIPSSSTNKEVDEILNTSKKSSHDLATEISQLLIDISVQDNSDDKEFMKANAGKVLDLNNIDKRTKRFQNAFSIIFDYLTYHWINKLQPEFRKWINRFSINKLSSWEKQIVFRWWFLLKDQNSLNWATVLIDEPEISLHPSRQLNILDYYRAIFTDPTNKTQTSQLFFTTHSPYVLKSFNSDEYKVFIFSRDETSQKVNIQDHNQLWKLYWTPTWWEINRYAYWLPTVEFHDELFWYLHDKYISLASDQNDANLRSSQNNFEDNYLNKQTGLLKNKSWTREYWWIASISKPVTLQTFIRNKVHHPENTTMQSQDFTIEELKQSIKGMISLI